MEGEAELRRLAAEHTALQTLVIGLLHQLADSGHGEVARGAFEQADRTLEIAVMALGERAPPGYARQAMEALERMRRMAFPASEAPRS